MSTTATITRRPERPSPSRRRPTPVWLISIYAVAMPLLAGLPRGVLFPVIRPSEALQAAVTLVALALVGLAALAGRTWRARLRPTEWWLLATAAAASVLPLLWLAARGLPIGADELLASFPFVKYAALYFLVRGAVRSSEDILDVARALVGSAMIVAFIAVAQGLKFGPVVDVLGRFFVSSAEDLVDDGRGTTTIGSSIATGAYLTLTGALALSLGLTPGRRRWLIPAAICLFGAVASGQAGTLVGLVVVVPAVARRHRRLAQLAAWSLPLSAVSLIGLWSVVSSRLADLDQGTGLPTSWLIRWNNVSELYLPSLKAGGWLLGVSPDAVVTPPDVWRTTIYLESGYLWLLWVGGIPLLAATLGLLISARRSLAPEGPAAPTDPIGATRAAAAAAVTMMAVLSIIDPHLTLRAGADVFFILLALAVADRPLFEATPATAWRWSHLLKGPGGAGDPAVRLQLSEIAPPRHRRPGRPETRLALAAVHQGHRVAAVELALHRTGRHLRGVLGPMGAGGAADRALLWRAVVLCADSLRLSELRLDAAEPGPSATTPADRSELVAAAREAKRLERARAASADRQSSGTADPADIARRASNGPASRPPVRIEVGPGVGWTKRAVDLVVGGLALAGLAPVWLMVAALVRRSGPGPVIFRQVRIGTGGLPFQIAKFRTMAIDNDDSAHREQNRRELLEQTEAVKDGDDPRITPVGHRLRRLSLDELPQLLNVLQGEMSLVGPRPSLLWESELFEPRYRRRLVTNPGLTGLWQVSGRADVSMTEMLELDLGYVDRMGPGVDLRCLVRTAGSVVSGEGAR